MKNLKNISYYAVALALVTSLSVQAQPHAQVKNTEDLAQQKTVVVENYPGIFKKEEIHKIERMDDKHSKIYYTRNNASFEAIVNSNREELLLIATFEQIPSTRMPAIVMDAFHKTDEGSLEIQKAFIGTTPSTSDFYRIDVYDKKVIKSLFYDHLGRYMPPPY